MAEEEYDVARLRATLLAHLGQSKADYYPNQLERVFPHILSRVVASWGQSGLDAYLNELMVPEHLERRGFPSEVAIEILQLAAVHGALGLSKSPEGTGWAGVEDADLYRKALKKE